MDFENLNKEVSTLVEILKASDVGEISLKLGEATVCVKSKPQAAQYASAPAAAVSAPAAAGPTAAAVYDGNVVKSPIVGTFYSASSPDKAAFVSVGSTVKKGDTLFIIESMKLMNEIQSEFDGTVSEILTQSGQGVEFGQPILVIK